MNRFKFSFFQFSIFFVLCKIILGNFENHFSFMFVELEQKWSWLSTLHLNLLHLISLEHSADSGIFIKCKKLLNCNTEQKKRNRCTRKNCSRLFKMESCATMQIKKNLKHFFSPNNAVWWWDLWIFYETRKNFTGKLLLSTHFKAFLVRWFNVARNWSFKNPDVQKLYEELSRGEKKKIKTKIFNFSSSCELHAISFIAAFCHQ